METTYDAETTPAGTLTFLGTALTLCGKTSPDWAGRQRADLNAEHKVNTSHFVIIIYLFNQIICNTVSNQQVYQ